MWQPPAPPVRVGAEAGTAGLGHETGIVITYVTSVLVSMVVIIALFKSGW